MTFYLTRVVLHSADRQDYEDLHGYMSAKGFTRSIRSGDRRLYTLPDAEYLYVGDGYTASAMHDFAEAAAKQTHRKCAILVIRGDSLAWSGLQEE